jgi:hypothetical protein
MTAKTARQNEQELSSGAHGAPHAAHVRTPASTDGFGMTNDVPHRHFARDPLRRPLTS